MTTRLALIGLSMVTKAGDPGKPNRLTKMKQSDRSNALPPTLPSPHKGGGIFERLNSNIRPKWVEDDARGRLGIKEGRLLRHDLPGQGDSNHVGNGRRPEQEGRLCCDGR